jgi:hypothetical protein
VPKVPASPFQTNSLLPRYGVVEGDADVHAMELSLLLLFVAKLSA